MSPRGILARFFKKGLLLRPVPKDRVAELQRLMGIGFENPEILRQALTHRSYVHENPTRGTESNGRMEFLGDSVLGLVANQFLYARFPLAEEGELTKMKSLLVSKAVLARSGRAMRLGQFLFLSEAEVESGGRERTSIIADSFEAIIGAIFLDQGLGAAGKFINEHLLRDANKIIRDSKHRNYKSILQEYVQGEHRVHPRYRVLSEEGPEHEKLFTVEVTVQKRVLGRGTGKNKKEAEQAAAREALTRMELLNKT
ncbi:MAG: ribonuclease III [Candidatus Eiseniibacteriota bacterium]|nr:MAG: ribonuclease III [Candidatus Eisenbacteria bacterium]